MNEETPPPLPPAAPVVTALPAVPLASAGERALARIMFIGGCVLVLPATFLTAYSFILIYLVVPVLITGLLNWGGWWLLLNYFRRGWDRPMKAQPHRVWLISAIYNGVGLLGFISLVLSAGGRMMSGDEPGMLAAAMGYFLWLLFATVAAILNAAELNRTSPAEVTA